MTNHKQDPEPQEENTDKQADIKTENSAEEGVSQQENVTLEKFNELNDRYLRLYSEFDNYRKRTVREKADIIKTAAEDVLKAILPVLDDFERAQKANADVSDAAAVKEGLQLIYNKFKNTVQQKGLQSFDSIGQEFNPDTMEAVTHIPASENFAKGTVVDEIEKGYKLGDKVVRFAKVVVAN